MPESTISPPTIGVRKGTRIDDTIYVWLYYRDNVTVEERADLDGTVTKMYVYDELHLRVPVRISKVPDALADQIITTELDDELSGQEQFRRSFRRLMAGSRPARTLVMTFIEDAKAVDRSDEVRPTTVPGRIIADLQRKKNW